MDSFVRDILEKWQLPDLLDSFLENAIDEDSFKLLDEGTIHNLIPKIGLRLKFLKHYRELMGNAVPPTAPLTSPDVPPATLPLEETTMVVDQTMPLVLHIIPVFEIWYAQGQNHRPATGFLEERLRNIRKRLRSMSRPQREAMHEPNRTFIPESAISDTRAEQLKEWLRNNTQPISQVEQIMLDTAPHRATWIRANGSKTIVEVLHEFPRLTAPGMIAQDFFFCTETLHQSCSRRGCRCMQRRSCTRLNSNRNCHFLWRR
ncbi:uncharacterized protein LOC124488068 [Hypomesus transpacificus]|uniref:uncharacterized protein LOC124488068 n=1 Tax=Hypomesus transpacificus TaxID=137520 RepID=UPI001F07EC35|nr:uncharacterized protein LOC124488068 [Hypomesus transpacificus]